ncbi:hypothetical protein N665_1930s0002 [Sinapis alba]|nr:hypothetical protein N665_1930s0002 [Sinapis alba]
MSLCIICKWIKAQSLERYTPGQSHLPSDTQSAEFYKTTSLMLRGAGYKHYEVSCFLSNTDCLSN